MEAEAGRGSVHREHRAGSSGIYWRPGDAGTIQVNERERKGRPEACTDSRVYSGRVTWELQKGQVARDGITWKQLGVTCERCFRL